MENEERVIETDTFLDEFEDWEDEEERWKKAPSGVSRRDRRSALRMPGGTGRLF